MSKVFIKEKSSGGIEVIVFQNPVNPPPGFIEKDNSEINVNLDKVRIKPSGEIWEDSTIETELDRFKKKVARIKDDLKKSGLSNETISYLLNEST